MCATATPQLEEITSTILFPQLFLEIPLLSCLSAYPQWQCFFSSPKLFKELVFRICISALQQLIAEVRTKQIFRTLF
jgi:hypothetical protein